MAHDADIAEQAGDVARVERGDPLGITDEALMKAVQVVGPTKVQPRRFRSLASAVASSGKPRARSAAGVTRFGRAAGSKRQA